MVDERSTSFFVKTGNGNLDAFAISKKNLWYVEMKFQDSEMCSSFGLDVR